MTVGKWDQQEKGKRKTENRTLVGKQHCIGKKRQLKAFENNYIN